MIDELKQVKTERDLYYNKLLIVRSKLQSKSINFSVSSIQKPQNVLASAEIAKTELKADENFFQPKKLNELSNQSKLTEAMERKESH